MNRKLDDLIKKRKISPDRKNILMLLLVIFILFSTIIGLILLSTFVGFFVSQFSG